MKSLLVSAVFLCAVSSLSGCLTANNPDPIEATLLFEDDFERPDESLDTSDDWLRADEV